MTMRAELEAELMGLTTMIDRWAEQIQLDETNIRQNQQSKSNRRCLADYGIPRSTVAWWTSPPLSLNCGWLRALGGTS
jgi:hypothetical protein